MRIKGLDFAIILLSAGMLAASALWAYGSSAGKENVVIQGKGGEWIYPLSSDRTIDVEGPLGSTRVEIAGNSARIADSPCRNKTCIASGSIARKGQWLACLPNEVLVRIEGGAGDAGLDASAY
jgi:hypothetical protein